VHDLSGARWRKSSRSGGNGGDCVEVARNLPGIVAIRDSKDPNGPAIAVPTEIWSTFLAVVKR
jgi:Domain of unknown function (DUF397)